MAGDDREGVRYERFISPLILVCLLATGSASTTENLQRETARFLGDISPEQVQVSNVKRGATNVNCLHIGVGEAPLCNRSSRQAHYGVAPGVCIGDTNFRRAFETDLRGKEGRLPP